MYLYLNSLGAVVRAHCAFLSCSLLTTTVSTHVFIEQINNDDVDDDRDTNAQEVGGSAADPKATATSDSAPEFGSNFVPLDPQGVLMHRSR